MEFNKEVSIALGKLFKDVSLKGERVELGSLDELKKALKRIEEDFKFMDNNKKISLKAIKDARLSLWVDADQSEKSLNRYVHPIINKFVKAAKELGVKPENIAEYKAVLKERDRLEDRIIKQKKEYK